MIAYFPVSHLRDHRKITVQQVCEQHPGAWFIARFDCRDLNAFIRDPKTKELLWFIVGTSFIAVVPASKPMLVKSCQIWGYSTLFANGTIFFKDDQNPGCMHLQTYWLSSNLSLTD